MARPRKDQEGPDARTRIIDAFWGMLAEGPYEHITVRALASHAHVNHNTIYRHFDSIENVARTAIAEVYTVEAASHLLMLFAHPELMVTQAIGHENIRGRFEKAIMVAHSGSPALIAALQDAIRSCWMQLAGTTWEQIPETTRLELTFILGGITSMLQNYENMEQVLASETFFQSPIGNAVRETFSRLHQEPHQTGYPA